MKEMRYLTLVALAILAAGCGVWNPVSAPTISYKQTSLIESGMSVEAVVTILGNPTYRSFNAEGEMLEFRSNPYGTSRVVKVRFVAGKVVSMDSYLDYRAPNCCQSASTAEEDKKETTASGTGVTIGGTEKSMR